jgi:flagellin
MPCQHWDGLKLSSAAVRISSRTQSTCAQSQLTNEATAESTIRDADLATEANLTKAQILIQAGVASQAQASSAPRQISSLLRSH